MKITKWALILIGIGGVILTVSAILFYHHYFGELQIVPNTEKWGQFGDYFGGVLNPALAFLALLGLLITIYQNQRELSLTREELRKTSISMQKQARYFEKKEELDELIKVIERIHNDLMNLFKRELTFEMVGDDGKTVISSKTESIGYILSGSSENTHNFIPNKISGGWSIHYNMAGGWLTELSDYLLRYRVLSGRVLIPKFYALRYFPSIEVLYDHEYFSDSAKTFYQMVLEEPDHS